MSSMQEYKEARVQYWEQMLGFAYNTNSTKFRAFTACKALCDHVDAMKASAAYYNTDYQISNSKPLQSSTDKFFDEWASQLWPNHSKCPKWLHDNGPDRLRFPQDTADLKDHLWKFIETKCTSHFKHNPDKRGTLASELGSSALTELDQQAPLWANTKRPPRRARGKKRRFDDCHPCYSYSDENDDDDEEPVSCKQERSSETMEPMHPKFVKFGSAHRLSTHITNLHLAFNTASFHQSDCRPYKRSAPRDKNMTSSAQSATFKPPHIPVETSADKALTDIQLALYIEGNHELAGVIELTDVTTRDDLFDMIQQDLQDELGIGDQFDVVRFQRTDGEAFPRPNARSMPIKRFGQQDMWKAMVKTMLEHKIGDLEGFVIVKKGGVETR